MANNFIIFHNEQTFFALSFSYDILNAQEHVTMNLMENLEKNHLPLASIQYMELLIKNAIC